jgi:hypothetical protein
MMATSRIRASAFLAGIAAVALGGCAVVLGSCAVVPAPAPQAGHPATAPVKAVSAPTPTPKQRAEADLASILRRFTPPPGAHRVSTSPASLLNADPYPSAGEPNNVGETEWWLAPGNPAQVLAWEAKRVSLPYGGGRPSGNGAITGSLWDDDFVLPDVPGVFIDRQLSVATTGVGHGQTGIEVAARDRFAVISPYKRTAFLIAAKILEEKRVYSTLIFHQEKSFQDHCLRLVIRCGPVSRGCTGVTINILS